MLAGFSVLGCLDGVVRDKRVYGMLVDVFRRCRDSNLVIATDNDCEGEQYENG